MIPICAYQLDPFLFIGVLLAVGRNESGTAFPRNRRLLYRYILLFKKKSSDFLSKLLSKSSLLKKSKPNGSSDSHRISALRFHQFATFDLSISSIVMSGFFSMYCCISCWISTSCFILRSVYGRSRTTLPLTVICSCAII